MLPYYIFVVALLCFASLFLCLFVCLFVVVVFVFLSGR